MDSLIVTRTISPALPKNVIRREGLIKRLCENTDKNLILVLAPGGYGKTTLMRDFLDFTKLNFAWVRVSPDIDNFYIFANYIITSFRNINPAFGENTQKVIEICHEKYELNKNFKTVIADVTGTLINDICKLFKDEIYLVLDDLGNIENSEWLSMTLNNLVENSPSNFHIIITSRLQPEINIATLQAKRKIFVLKTDDLTFNTGEIAELLDRVYSIEYTDGELRTLEANIGGWITGIHLILQAWGKNFAKLKVYNETVLENIFNFFAEDIFKNLSTKIQNFLLDTALIEDFTSKETDGLLNIEDSKVILDFLLNRNIFLQINPEISNGEGKTSFYYQILFKKFLLSKLNELRSVKEIDSMYINICSFFQKKGNFDKAISYGLLSGNYEFVLPLIKGKFQDYYDNGKLDVLWKWFETLEEKTIESDPNLLFYKSLLIKFYIGDKKRSLDYVDKASSGFRAAGNKQSEVRCIISKAQNLLGLTRIKESITILKNLKLSESDFFNKAKQKYLLAYSFYLSAQYDDSLKILNEALDICIENEIKEVQRDIYNLYGHIYLIRGEYSKSASYYERVEGSSSGVIDKHETLCNLVLLYSQTGKFEKAYEFLEKDSELVGEIPIPIFKITHLLAKQALVFEFGDYEGAITILEEVLEIALTINHQYFMYLSRVLTADSYYYLNNLRKAEEYYELAFNYIDDENKHEKSQYAFVKALLLKKESAQNTDKSIEPAVEKVLLETYAYYRENDFVYEGMQVSFHLAEFYLYHGLPGPAVHYLSECLKVSAEKEYISALQREFMDSRIVFDFALANNIEKDFVKFIRDSVISKNEVNWVSAEFRKRFEIIYKSFYDVYITTFKKLEFRVRGELVLESDWGKKKWKLALLYMFLSSNKEVTKDKLIDVFYTDTPVESADNIFHQLISRLRSLMKIKNIIKIIEPESNVKKKISKGKDREAEEKEFSNSLQFIIYENKILKFNRDFNYYIDIDEFEKFYKKSNAELNQTNKIKYAEKAISLYKGEFLEGIYEFWSEELRNKIRSSFVSISEELIRFFFGLKLYEKVIYYSDNLLVHDKLNETAFMNIIHSLVLLERIGAAKEKYDQMLKIYENELEEKPPEKLLKQIEKLLSA